MSLDFSPLSQAIAQLEKSLGNERGLLRSDWNTWRTYRQARTDSSHTYDAAKAEAVFAIAPDFLLESRTLLGKLLAQPSVA